MRATRVIQEVDEFRGRQPLDLLRIVTDVIVAEDDEGCVPSQGTLRDLIF